MGCMFTLHSARSHLPGRGKRAQSKKIIKKGDKEEWKVRENSAGIGRTRCRPVPQRDMLKESPLKRGEKGHWKRHVRKGGQNSHRRG